MRFTLQLVFEVMVLYPVDSRFFMGTSAKKGTSFCSVIFLALDHYSSVFPLLTWCHMQDATSATVSQALIAKFVYFR